MKRYSGLHDKLCTYDWRIYTKNRKENIKPQI